MAPIALRLYTSTSTSGDSHPANMDDLIARFDANTRNSHTGENITYTKSPKLYPGHIPTSSFQKVLLSVGSAFAGLINPERQEMIATLGETTGECTLRFLRDKMLKTEEGKELLRKRPLITEKYVNVPFLRTLPDGTFGREYVRFLDINKVSPDTRCAVQFVDDEELAYVMVRYRQIHDYIHTLLDLETTVACEVAVKWFEMCQTGLPMTALSSVFGPFRLSIPEKAVLFTQQVPWAIRNGTQSDFLLAVQFEKYFDMPVEELRRKLKVIPYPRSQ
eukprot:CFRG3408T1